MKRKGSIIYKIGHFHRRCWFNIGIAASGAGRCNFGCLHRCTLVRADEFQFGFLLLTSTLYFQLGSGSGLDEQ